MGQTQHTVGTANVRASCILLLATGNVGGPGSGANIFRGHTNVQGATDLGVDVVTLPLYYGLIEPAWRHWSRVWEVDFDWLKSRFDTPAMMNTPGIPSTRWHDATLLAKDDVAQKDNLKAMIVMGHGGNTVTRMPNAAKGTREARSAGRGRSASDHLGGARRTQERHLSAAGCHQLRNQRFAHRVQPRDPVGRADRQADLRVQRRPGDHVSPRQEARLRRQDVQEHQGRRQSAGGRRCPARDQPRRLVDRLLRPVAGAPEIAHGASGRLRHAHAEGHHRSEQGRLSTACRGHVGARRSSGIPARRCSTTRTCRSKKAAARSAPASASSARRSCRTAPAARSACSATAITPRTPRSRTAIRSSPTACSRSSAGTRI